MSKSKNKKGFTLIELIAVLVILAVIALIVTPLVLNIVDKAKVYSNKRSIDAYGKAIDLAITAYLMNTGDFPTSIEELTIEYTGSKVECGVAQLNEDSSVYLSKCKVDGIKVKDSKNEDGWYHYGEKKIPTVDTIIGKANAASVTDYYEGNIHLMYTFTHPATEQTEALTDYRYIGNDPYNYVTFNNELWRIIGVFTVEDGNGNKEQRIKIIRNESIGDYAWDSNSVNEWPTASLQTYLNGDYYNSLSDEAKAMIGDTKYYLGGSATHSGHSGPTYYAFERGTTVYSGRSTNWIGKIGLMYPSDYSYTYANGVDNKCYTDTNNCNGSTPSSGWLYKSAIEWLISPFSGISFNAFVVYSYGYVNSRYVTTSSGVRPSVYLISSIQLDKGTGTEDDPYTLTYNRTVL